MHNIIIASGPVIVENKKVLLDISGEDDFWKFCGGKPKDNENLHETARRRSKEELGIDIEIIDNSPFLMHTIKEDSDIILVHWLSKRTGEINPGQDIKKWEWIPFDELKNLNLAPNIIPTLKHFEFIK